MDDVCQCVLNIAAQAYAITVWMEIIWQVDTRTLF